MGLVLGWRTAVKFQWPPQQFFKKNLISFILFGRWRLFSSLLSTLERLNKLVDWIICSMQNNVHSGTHKNKARSRNNILENSSTFKTCCSQRKSICPLYQILSNVRFNTVSIIAGGKESKLNVCYHHNNRTPPPWLSVLVCSQKAGKSVGHKGV